MAAERPSKRVFLIRRLIVLVIAAGVIWALVAGISAAAGWVASLFGGAKPVASASASNGSNTAAGAAKYTTCMPKGLSLQAIVGDGSKPQSSFAAGSNPRFWFVITNTSEKPCYLNVGTAAQVYKVTSGSESIWSNSQCKAATSNYRMLLQPGTPQTASPIVWERVRSSSSGCDKASGQSTATGGGASYHLQVVLSGLQSNDVQFILN